MKHPFFRPLVAALAATGALSVSVAHAATGDPVVIEFKEFYNTATILNFTDTKELIDPIATLTLKDDVNGNVQGTLKFLTGSGLPSKSSGLSIDALWLQGDDKGAVTFGSGPSATATYYKHGFYKQGDKFNYDLDYKNAFNVGSNSSFTIKGVTVDSFLTADGADIKGVMLDVTGVGKPYTGFLGLNKNVRFIGTIVPEPSTYALMGLGLVGIFAASRRKRA